MSLRQQFWWLVCFYWRRAELSVARNGTLGAAARSLGLSHPTMGRRLQAMEQSTGQVLFQRTTEGFVLTEQATAILPLVTAMEMDSYAPFPFLKPVTSVASAAVYEFRT